MFYTPEVGTQVLLGCGGPVMSGVPPAFPGREEENCPTWSPCAALDASILSLEPCSMQIAWWHDHHPFADEDMGFGRVKGPGKDRSIETVFLRLKFSRHYFYFHISLWEKYFLSFYINPQSLTSEFFNIEY